jgi:EpsI family protein
VKPNLTRAIAAFLLMIGASVLSFVAVPTELLSATRQSFDLHREIPTSFGDWTLDESVVPIPPSPDQAALLTQIYDQILSRTYINSRGERVMLSITYGSRQNQQMRAHRQEVCYSAQGFKIAQLERKDIKVADAPITSTRMVAVQGQRVEPVTYWFTMGDEVVMTYLDRELVQFKYAMSGYIPDGYLVRVSNLSGNSEQAFRDHILFADTLFQNLKTDLRYRLIGNSKGLELSL